MKIRTMAVGGTGFVDPHCLAELATDNAASVRSGNYFIHLDAEAAAAADATHVLPLALQPDGFHVTIGAYKFAAPMRLESPPSIERGGCGTPSLTGGAMDRDQWRPVALSAPVVVA